MTDNMKKFAELLSTDAGVKKELEASVAGLGKDDKKAFTDASIKVAAGHGITLTDEDFRQETKELSLDEMQAVAGGKGCNVCNDWGYFVLCAFTLSYF